MAAMASELTLVDYFAVIGLDKNIGLRLDPSLEVLAELSGTSGANERLPPLERTYEAKILAHFPEKRRGHPFLHEISSLCMPKGLKFYTEKNVPMLPHFHSFVVIKGNKDGTRVNGCALTIYEEVKDELIRQTMFDLQMEHVKEISAVPTPSRGGGGGGEKSSSPLMSSNYDSRIRQQPGTISSGNHTMPRHISAKKNRSKRISYYDNISKPIFVAKCLCVLTRIPMVFTSEKILRTIADIISKNHAILPIPLESFIYWILHEVPLPVHGTTFQLNYNSIDLIVIRPHLYELPYFDYPLQQMFNYISIEKFLKLFTCFMLEHQILLCSKYMDRLMLIAESLSTLVFPFRWQLTYVPILPYSQLKFIEAPVPYLMGLCYDDFIPDQIYQSNVCILDIDTGKLDFPEDVPQFPKYRQVSDEIHKIITHCQESFAKQKRQQNFEATINNSESSIPPIPKVVMRKKVGNKRDDLWSMKRMSRSFDNHDSLKAAEDVYRHQREQEQQAAAALVLQEDDDNRNSNSPARMTDDDGYETASQSPISAETQVYFQYANKGFLI
uniref:UDENN domain-containing protein n=1 Tax=Panagrolaimus superbus TaxID=310955 RepID=A0A914Y157_9BILA